MNNSYIIFLFPPSFVCVCERERDKDRERECD